MTYIAAMRKVVSLVFVVLFVSSATRAADTLDGDFELGPDTSWRASDPAVFQTVAPARGQWHASLGTIAVGHQVTRFVESPAVTIPSGADVRLFFAYRMVGTASDARLSVLLRDPVSKQTLQAFDNVQPLDTAGRYTLHTEEITPLAGRRVEIYIEGFSSGKSSTTIDVDMVSIGAYP
jgi:hypothetical protein